MTNLTTISQDGQGKEQEIWWNLRKAIAKSSGFQSWQRERKVNTEEKLDTQVRRYLTETLETLAY